MNPEDLLVPHRGCLLAFGSGDFAMAQVVTIEAIENADFIIERRASADYSENIYFSSAPVSTSEHLKILALTHRI